MLVQNAHPLGPRRLARVDRLETDQKRRDIVTGLRVQLDLLDEDGSSGSLQSEGTPHTESSEDSPESRLLCGNTVK